MTDVITRAGYRITRKLGDRTYVLRAPSFGEVGALVEDGLGHLAPTAPVINDQLRQALREADREDLIAAVDEVEEAEDYLGALRAEREDGESSEALVEANVRLRRALRARQLAEAVVADSRIMRDIRVEGERFQRAYMLSTLVLTLVDWSGPNMPPFPEKGLTAEWLAAPDNLPGGDISTLAAEARALIEPTKVQAGN